MLSLVIVLASGLLCPIPFIVFNRNDPVMIVVRKILLNIINISAKVPSATGQLLVKKPQPGKVKPELGS